MAAGHPVFALVAGEASGDILGADLIAALREKFPGARFEGIGGERMQALGFQSLFPLERLSVMGFVEPLKRLPELLRMRRKLATRYKTTQPLAFIGIDAPDFNLGLEKKLRRAGVKTVHYVSPSVWAWRQGRIKKIRKAVDLMLTLFPFEAAFYEKHNVPVQFVGHPLANQLGAQPDKSRARRDLGLPENGSLLTIMPGSRASEIELMAPLFLEVARQLRNRLVDLRFLMPAASGARYARLVELLEPYQELEITLIDGRSHLALEAADSVLLTSGTTALEAMLLKKPMVVSYRMGKFSYALISRLVKTPYVSLPNLLAGRELVPELIQHDATVGKLVDAVLAQFDKQHAARLAQEFEHIHDDLRLDSGRVAADAIAALVAS